jgi:putative oxidoreductase
MSLPFVIGRLIVGAYYLYNGIHHFLELSQLAAYAKSKGVPAPEIAVAGAGLLLLLAGITILLGYEPRVGIAALVLFFVPVTIMMHNFWAVPADQETMQMIQFTKNFALLGSALMFLKIPRPWPLSLGRKKK